MAVGKALTGGYVTLAATITTQKIADAISSADPGVFMHGPTFMGNPLACAIANASIDLLLSSNWENNVDRIEKVLAKNLEKCKAFSAVKDVRTLGAIGVVEMNHPVPVGDLQRKFISHGVWLRPFGRLIYVMPPFIISNNQIEMLCNAIIKIIEENF